MQIDLRVYINIPRIFLYRMHLFLQPQVSVAIQFIECSHVYSAIIYKAYIGRVCSYCI